MFDLSIWRCSPALKEVAERIAGEENRHAERVAEERKKRNYADFWVRERGWSVGGSPARSRHELGSLVSHASLV